MSLSAIVKSLYMSYAGGTLGTMVFRTASVPVAAAWLPIFTVSNGNVLMTMLIGETTVLEATAATNMDIQIDPTAAAMASVSLCALTAVTDNDVGTIYTFTGNAADPAYAAGAVPGGMAGGSLAQGQNMHGWIIPPGNVEWRESVAVPTHEVQWYMFYVPIDRGATVAAA